MLVNLAAAALILGLAVGVPADSQPGNDSQPGDAPVAASLTAELRGEITFSSPVPEAAQLTITVGAERTGEWTSGWLDEEFLGWRQVDENGYVQLAIPAEVSGEHRLVLLDAASSPIGWDQLSVYDTDAQGQPVPGVSPLWFVGGAAVVLAAALGLFLVLRPRHHGRRVAIRS